MDYPQIIYIALSFMGSGMHLAKNGETREEKYHFGKDLLARMVILGLLYWGGFFDCWIK